MAITIELPPQMEKEARGYSMLEGSTLERMFLDYLRNEFERRRKAADAMARLDALVEKSRGRLKGEPYKFTGLTHTNRRHPTHDLSRCQCVRLSDRRSRFVEAKAGVRHYFRAARMIREICMVKPAKGREVDCYFTTGHVRRFDMTGLLGPDCGPVFRPLRDRKTFLSTMTVINGTLAFDVAGNRNEYKCVDIDPETIFAEGRPVRVH